MKTQNSQYSEVTFLDKLNTMIDSISPMQLVKNYKLKKVQKLLETTDFKLAQIAYIVGMEPDDLSKSFINKYGMTPSQYRQQNYIG